MARRKRAVWVSASPAFVTGDNDDDYHEVMMMIRRRRRNRSKRSMRGGGGGAGGESCDDNTHVMIRSKAVPARDLVLDRRIRLPEGGID